MPNRAAMREQQPIRGAVSLDYTRSGEYLIGKPSYAPQYAHLYFCRLCALRSGALSAGRMRWGGSTESLKYAERLVDIRPSESVESHTVIIGVIFREMAAKPSILRQYNTITNMLIPPPPDRRLTPYHAASDEVIIEDENGRCTLDIRNISQRTRAFTTGIVLAVRGYESLSSGMFVVHDYATIGAPPQRTLAALPADRFVAFVSGLEFGDVHGFLGVELLLEYLKGNIGNDEDVLDCASIVHLVVAGNLVHSGHSLDNAGCIRNVQHTVEDQGKSIAAEPVVEVDRFLTAAASVMSVTVMPGENDPVNYLIPQQPIHRCLLPSASRSENLHRAPNPLGCEIGERIVYGTSGQPVSDFVLYGQLPRGDDDNDVDDDEDVLDVLETMVDARHLAPTCPDTLASYPFSKNDPFVLEETPHVFFAGNQPQFASRMYTRKTGGKDEVKVKSEDAVGNDVQCRLIAIPKFRSTGRIVLVNLRTLDCTVREFAMDV